MTIVLHYFHVPIQALQVSASSSYLLEKIVRNTFLPFFFLLLCKLGIVLRERRQEWKRV